MRTPVQNWSFARICYTKTMTKADSIFKENIRKIMEEGVFQKMLVHVTRMEM